MKPNELLPCTYYIVTKSSTDLLKEGDVIEFVEADELITDDETNGDLVIYTADTAIPKDKWHDLDFEAEVYTNDDVIENIKNWENNPCSPDTPMSIDETINLYTDKAIYEARNHGNFRSAVIYLHVAEWLTELKRIVIDKQKADDISPCVIRGCVKADNCHNCPEYNKWRMKFPPIPYSDEFTRKLIGYVDDLHFSTYFSDNGVGYRAITLWDGLYSRKISVSKEDYTKAVQAHLDGKKVSIMVNNVHPLKGKYFNCIDGKDVEIMQDDKS